MYVLLSLSDNVLLRLSEEKTIKDTWDQLIKLYKSNYVSTRLYLRRIFLGLKMQEIDKISYFSYQFKFLKNQLVAYGSTIAEEDVVMTLLESFPEFHCGLVIALSTQAKLDLSTIIATLLEEEIRRKDVGLNDENATTPFFSCK